MHAQTWASYSALYRFGRLFLNSNIDRFLLKFNDSTRN